MNKKDDARDFGRTPAYGLARKFYKHARQTIRKNLYLSMKNFRWLISNWIASNRHDTRDRVRSKGKWIKRWVSASQFWFRITGGSLTVVRNAYARGSVEVFVCDQIQ